MPPRDAAPESEYAVVCEDLVIGRSSATRVERIVDGVSLAVPVGGALAVLGPTGSGKSSLLGVLSGRNDAELGVIGGRGWVHGIPIRHPGRKRRTLLYLAGFLRQGAAGRLPARLTVAEVIGEPITSRDRRVNARALAVRTAALLDELALPLGAAVKYPYELSAGMRQRVALARALVLDPKLLVADDPMANLDVEVRHVVWDAIERRRASASLTAIVATNDEELVSHLSAERIVLHHGVVTEQSGVTGVRAQRHLLA